jgi:hypothetical protein
LKSAGVTGLATAVTSAGVADVDAQTGPRIVGPGEVPVTLLVNGKRVDLKIEPRVTRSTRFAIAPISLATSGSAIAARAAPAR